MSYSVHGAQTIVLIHPNFMSAGVQHPLTLCGSNSGISTSAYTALLSRDANYMEAMGNIHSSLYPRTTSLILFLGRFACCAQSAFAWRRATMGLSLEVQVLFIILREISSPQLYPQFHLPLCESPALGSVGQHSMWSMKPGMMCGAGLIWERLSAT